ncbi:MAG: patatin-like phospholipase family protein [Spirochaetes bacterium]|nr:patatin-like phospholipase family protein [Spirochaetota bacterium]
MNLNTKGYALVLSGGGAKGVYHIGVWKALLELRIPIRAVIGTSAGSIAAAFIAQGDFSLAEKILSDLTVDKIIDLPEMPENQDETSLRTRTKKWIGFIKDKLIKNKGLDTSPLRNILETQLNEQVIRQKGMELGLATWRLSDFKPIELFLEDLEDGRLVDYLIASASYPGFKTTEIKDKQYIDGGVFKNIPYSLAKERGYKKIIVVDITNSVNAARFDISQTETIYIKNSLSMKGLLDFNQQALTDYQLLGYLDTMKTFDRNVGIHYFLDIDDPVYQQFEKLLNEYTVIKDYHDLLKKSTNNDPDTSLQLRLKGLLPDEMRHYQYILVSLAECAALSLDIPRLKKYTFSQFVSAINNSVNQVDHRLLIQNPKQFQISEYLSQLKDLKSITAIKQVFKTSVYEFHQMLEKIEINDKKFKFPGKSLTKLYPFIIGAKIFLVLIKHYQKKNLD